MALVAHDVYDEGGMERACAELIRRARDQCDFVVLSSSLAPALRDGVAWRRIPAPRRPFPLRFLVFGLIAGLRLLRVHADVVHTVGAIVPNRVDVASVHLCHAGFVARTNQLAPAERTPFRRLNTAITRILSIVAERWSYRRGRARILAAVSAGVADELSEHYATVPVAVTPNGVDPVRYRPDTRVRRELRRELEVGDDDLVALFVGGDWDHKGLATAIEAVGLTGSRGAPPWALWVVGRGDSNRYSEIARRAGVSDRVRFFGARGDVERFYQAADAFVSASLYETFSLAAHEAAATALPLLSTRVSGIAELVGDGAAGFVLERTPAAFAAALDALAADPDLRAAMGRAARERAAAFTWGRSAEAVLAHYMQLVRAEANSG